MQVGSLANQNRRNRSGTSVIEVMVTGVVLAAVVVTATPLLGWVSASQRTAARLLIGQQELTNQMESIQRIPWSDLTDERLAQLALSDVAREALPDAELSTQLTRSADDLPSKEVLLKLSWTNRAGARRTPIQLSCWRYAIAPAEEGP